MTDKFNSFVALAKQRYRITLTSVEEKLLKAIVAGEVADYQVKSPELDNPAQVELWGEERILSAEFIYWLCTDVEAFKYFTNHGLQVRGAKISGELNLEFVKFESLLYFTECVFIHKIILRGVKVEEVKFNGSHVVGIDAALIEVRGSLCLNNGFQSKGEVNLGRATIGCILLCNKGHFSNPEGYALIAQGIEVKADVFLRYDFKAEGRVSLSGATIGGQLDCSGGHFSNQEGDALFAENIEVKADVFLRNGFQAKGRVNLLEATIGGQLNCIQGHFFNQEGDALFAENIEVKGSVFLSNNFKAEGRVSLSGATIGGQLNCIQGHFSNQQGDALCAENIEVKNSVILSNCFKADGRVRLSGANIGGQLGCSGSYFSSKEGDALNAQNIEVKSSVFLDNGFKSEGRVSLFGATIGGQLDCSGGHFSNQEGDALFAQNIEVKTNIILSKGFKAEGKVDLTAANIKGNLNCTQGNFSNEKGKVLSAEGINVDGDILLDEGTFKGKIYLVSARVDDTLSMVKIKESKQMKLDLQFARIGRLRDHKESWPEKNNLNLDGFIYQKFGADDADDNIKVPKDSKTRLEWLRLKPENEFFPQTYEQLAEVLKKEGDTDAATEILIHKERDIRPKLNGLSKFWNGFLDKTIAYGYKPTKALVSSAIFISFGWNLFGFYSAYCLNSISNNKCPFSPSSEISLYSEETNDNKKIDIDYPEFNFWLYSLDTFIPIVDLHQQEFWLPNPKKGEEIPLILFKVKAGRLLRWYLWIHIIFGWILTSLWVAGFSGLVRG
ncbi:MAG: hypothetical protein F6K25_24595 [Okeania sp. SIO2G4]|uniref:hypothetical protein n=1 Tax=Okeania sp. SIO2G4 TaxID=2607793 RepID=UPI0013CB0545|nr:hypothetical protein [Okeania sp. SIO2G4]NEQ93668.1 hypothetical protein [Okeania sp. SIO2G4]